MSSREKKIYAEITVPGNKSEQSVNTKTTYRGMSTVNPDNNQHSPNENLRVGNLIESIRTHVSLLVQPYKK